MPVIRERRFLRVKLDMVGRCQLRCIMCHFSHPDFVENKATMGGELLEKVASELFPLAHDVVLSSGAEPLLAPDLPRALDLCRQHEVPFFHFSTNLFAMNKRIMEKVLEVQMPLLTISIDAATKETFERIRPPGKWETLMQRLELVQEMKKAAGSALPALSATAVLMRSNVKELPDLVRLLWSKGVTQMNFVHMAVMGDLGVEGETLLNDPRLCNQMLHEIKATADAVGMHVCLPMEIPEALGNAVEVTDAKRSEGGNGSALRRSPAAEAEAVACGSPSVGDYQNHKIDEFLLKAKKKVEHRRACYFPWYYIHVNPDGTVFPCGSWFEFSSFGDFKTQTFKEIWTGKPFTELRNQILNMQLRDVCANCSVANMGRPDVVASFSHRAKVRRDGRTCSSTSSPSPAAE